MNLRNTKPKPVVGVRMAPEMRKRVEAVAKQSGVKMSAALVQLLGWALDRHEAEVARRAK